MRQWVQQRIDGFGRVVTGKTPSSERLGEFGTEAPFLTPSDIPGTQKFVTTDRFLSQAGMDAHKRIVLPAGSTSMVCIGATIGKCCMTHQPTVTNQQINSIVPDIRRHSPCFVYYLSTTLKDALVNFAGGSATPIINKSTFSGIKVNAPGLIEQRKIAAVLSAYDDLIENNRRRIALLERMAEQLYREWFVRFRFPGYQQAKFLKGIPSGWETALASHFFGYVRGKSYSSEELSDDPKQAPFITLKSFNRGGGYRADGLKRFSGRHKPEQLVRQNDIVMAVTDMTQDREVIGRAARVPDLGAHGAVISMDVIKLVPKTISASFLYSYLRLSGFGEFIKEFANGTNVLHLKPDLVTQQRITMPPEGLRDQFSAIIEPIFEQIDVLSKANVPLEASRDLLLPRLISGKLRVDDLDIRFPPSMQAERA